MDYLNPDLDFAALGRTLRTEGRVLIRDFFTPQVAEALDRALQAIDWELVYRDATGDRRLTGEQLRSLTPQQRMQLTEGIHGIAREGFQFSFFSDSLVRAVKDGRSDLLARFMRWMADDAFLSRMRELSGDPEINGVFAQATMYSRGNFLTTHDDHVDREDRRIAYVINLTPRWRPDCPRAATYSMPARTAIASRSAWAPRCCAGRSRSCRPIIRPRRCAACASSSRSRTCWPTRPPRTWTCRAFR